MNLSAFVLGFGLFAILGLAEAAAEPAKSKTVAPDTPRVRRALDALSKVPELTTGTLGFFLSRIETPDQPLVTRNHRQSFIPASTIKSLTTGTALELLGPDYRFETTLAYDEATGDVIIRGSGDPSLARGGWDELFAEWSNALLEAGIREVRGRIVSDETAWEARAVPDGWTWLDIGNYFASPLTPLTFHDNEFRLYFRLDGEPGELAHFYDAEPWPDGLQIIDEVRIGKPGTGDEAYVSGGPGASVYRLRGTLARDAGKEFIRGALPDPALFCAQEFTRWLEAREVPVHGTATTTRRPTADPLHPPPSPRGGVLASRQSDPLSALLVPINHQSLNLDCECLLVTLGHGQMRAGLQRIREHLAGKNLGLAGYQQTDGSGLSRTNMITPELLARVNASVLTGPYGAVFRASLPVAGESGTLRKIGSQTQGRIRAKSGTIERVKCYLGLVEAASGQEFIFSVMVNNYDGPIAPVFAGMSELFEALAGL
jgi:serine-type D-Ala-D-Ala carboxypeptidase/endopeptidase (penicillin-binding protein 4)